MHHTILDVFAAILLKCPPATRVYRGIFVYNIFLISIRDSVFDQATKITVLILKGHNTINCPKEFDPDVSNKKKFST